MSKPLSYSYFQKQYMQRIAAGELFIPEPESPAVDMFIAELNKSPKGDADFSVYKLDDIEWGDFLGDIFSSEEYRDHTETGFEYRAIAEDACAQALRSFIGKIKKVETKLALLKHFMSDEFRQNVLTKGYCAYGSSADMIQLQCAKLMGEINRSLHGEVAPDLANLPDDYGADLKDNKPKKTMKKLINTPYGPQVLEIYELTNANTSDDYYDEHEPIAALLRQGKMIHALDQSIECTIDIVRSFYEDVKADEEGKLIFYPNQCDPIDVTIYRFHQQMIDRFETIDAKGNPIHKPDYQFFFSNYQVLQELKQQCRLYISPQLWNDQATKYVQQAYYLQYELRRRHYDVEYSYVYYEIFKMGYESPLYKPKGECANEFLKLIVQIREEFNLAREIRKQAEDYAVSFPDMPGDRPLLFDTYNANRLLRRPTDPVLWLSMDMSMSTNQIDKRIQWLDTIQYKEADTLSNNGVSADEIGLVKYGCKLLRNFYRRLKGIILRDGEAATYLRSMKPEDRMQAEFNVFFMNTTAEEMFAIAQAMCDGNHRRRNIPALQALLELPDYTDKLLSYSLYECLLYLCTATRFRQSYLQNKMVANYSELKINEFLGDYFRIYTDLRKEQIRESIFSSKLSYKKPSDTECLIRLSEESQQCVTDCKANPQTDAFVLQLCEHYLQYLQENYPESTPQQSQPDTMSTTGLFTSEHTSEFYDFRFMCRHFVESESYRKFWLYRSRHNHFRFTFEDLFYIEPSSFNPITESKPLRIWLRKYVDEHPDYNINLSLADDRDECFEAIAYIVYQIFYAFFKDCGPIEYGKMEGYTHREFVEMSFEEFCSDYMYLQLWREAIDSFAPHDNRVLQEKDSEIARLKAELAAQQAAQKPAQQASPDGNTPESQLVEYLMVRYKDKRVEDCENMLRLLREPKWQKPKDQARFALAIYKSGHILTSKKPNTFKEWYELYCQIFGLIPNQNYKESKLTPNEATRQIELYL